MEQRFSPAWLARRAADPAVREAWRPMLSVLSHPRVRAGRPLESAVHELTSGLEALLGIKIKAGNRETHRGLRLEVLGVGTPGSFTLTALDQGVRLSAADEAGLLYGVFRLLRDIALGLGPDQLPLTEAPHRPIRMLNHWDNLDGSIERGYAGRSFFFADGKVLAPGPRLAAYARLLASTGINAVAINNVNVHGAETELVTGKHLKRLAEVAAVFRAWGVRLYLSANFASPITLGDLETADPVDAGVASWWAQTAKRVWAAIPDFGGFVVKADSEGRPGPFTYGRDHADGANMLARAVEPFGGTIFWRCFVYNSQQDWRDRSTDRARAAFDHFRPLDGRFLPNVCLQIKNGPMDFQVREPVSPLFGAMPRTRQVLELQVTQEYTGQQRHVCYLPEQWRHVFDFQSTPAAPLSNLVDGITAVANVGDDPNWTGHDLAQANWYAFGRLTWNPALDPADLAREWAALTFGTEPSLVEGVTGILLGSWLGYEAYTAPLGVGWMVNPSHHYGPNPDGYEYDRWGTYHFADLHGIGVDRTASGTGYAGQYTPASAAVYENPALCPDEYLLFFHHVPYLHRLKSGKTVIQHIYDSHFEGADWAASLEEKWAALASSIDPEVHAAVAKRLGQQVEHAGLWRDVINTYFHRKSGIGDEKKRVIPR